MPVVEEQQLSLNALEKTRRSIGLMRPAFLRAIGASSARVLSAETPSDYLIVNALRLHVSFRAYAADVRQRLGASEWLSSREVCDATGLGEFQLSQLKHRHRVYSMNINGRSLYGVSQFHAMLGTDYSSTYQSPLAPAFLRYLAEHPIVLEQAE